MTIDLMTIPATEAERLSYAEGFTRTAALFARIADLELERDQLNDAVTNLENELADAYKAHRDARCEVESLQAELSALRWLER
jgi:chromosome segregation ATPase